MNYRNNKAFIKAAIVINDHRTYKDRKYKNI